MTNKGTGFRFTLCVVGVASLAVATWVRAADWPQWRGPARDGRSADTGLLQRWGPDGPALAWKATGLGTGYASIAVVGDRLCTVGDLAYVTSGYDVGCHAFRITAKDGRFSVEEVYASKEMANHHGGVVQAGGKVFGHSDGRGLVCQEISSGKVLWAEKDKLRKGCVSFADGMLYFREEDKDIFILVRASPDGFAEQGRFAQPDRARQKAWPHPTIAHGRLYLRDQGTLLCYEAKGK
ncbi:MAG: hypothetical protein KA354_01565 [Phycisphaerae bacterium]|nr:hypothetical protein [Phycisphaerae bacterium]